MSVVEERAKSLVAHFSQLKGWEQKYSEIIRLGKTLEPLDVKDQQDKFLVKGCQSKVWLHAQLGHNGKVYLMADSDALIVRGLVAILLKIYSEATPDDILKNPPYFFSEMGLNDNLSPSRTNGLHAMVKQIMLYATAFKALAGKPSP